MTFINLSKAELIEHAIKNNEGYLSDVGSFVVETGKYTGRSPHDKFTVYDENTKDEVWFHDGNKKISKEAAEKIFAKIKQYHSTKNIYECDAYVGAKEHERILVKFFLEKAWHALFVRNMFIDDGIFGRVSESEHLKVYHAPMLTLDAKEYEINSEACIILDLSKKRILIAGTRYAGEIKKSVFTYMNYILPKKNHLGMHCAANEDKNGSSSLFFGLSGTGKTTLSASSARGLIGDDEHGWDDRGIYNFEGGCYAKTIRLSKKDEPQIYDASRRFTSILENVKIDLKTRELDFNDASKTENTRSSYDLFFIPGAVQKRASSHPSNIVFLTCDAFGVMPPIAKLSPKCAAYHFLSGYTAKVAGTERGVTEPKAVFSPCFGSPFMAHHPQKYMQIFYEKVLRFKPCIWLINTGWTKGPYGKGERMKLSYTRKMLDMALDGELQNIAFTEDERFLWQVPENIAGLPKDVLQPKKTWDSEVEYEKTADHLVDLFIQNFKPYLTVVSEDIASCGPKKVKG